MFRIITFILLFTFSANARELQSDLVIWNSHEGMARLERSNYKHDFYQLVNFYQPQINPLYCGVATSVIILNALENGHIANQKDLAVAKPASLGGGELEYRAYSQYNFLNAKTDKIKAHEIIELKRPKEIKDGKEVFDPGLTLLEFADILHKVHKLKIRVTFADKNTDEKIEKFRQVIKKSLQDDKVFVVVNFDGKILGTKTGGHISPLAAYDEESDSVLVLDVALHKGTVWYFVPLTKLYEAMNSKDGEKYRGYVEIWK